MQQSTGQCSLVSGPLRCQSAVVTPIRRSPAAVSRPQQFESHARAKQLCRPNRSRCMCLSVAGSREAEKPRSPETQVSVSLEAEISHLQRLLEQLQLQHSAQDKVQLLQKVKRVADFCRHSPRRLKDCLRQMPAEQEFMLLCLPAMGQQHILRVLPTGDAELKAALSRLADVMQRADVFYSSLGGILGYQAKCLELIQQNRDRSLGCSSTPDSAGDGVHFHMPQGPDLDGIRGREIAAAEAAKGLEALPHMAEIWPLGGAGDRLGLQCSHSGKSVPTAMLPYCGRTLLEGLIRDLQARESLYFKLYGVQCTTPIVIMTSDAKDNHQMVCATLEAFNWFGRGRHNFRLIRQPLVPVVSAVTGQWVLPEPLSPMLKPGGHGAVWKLMLDEGVFDWLSSLDRQATLIRQISNPLAGTDATMLALTGAGYADGRTFGFASCERAVGATEGMNVLMEQRLPQPDGSGFEYSYNVANVEYTEFERLGITDETATDGAHSVLPANTNILYVSLKAAEAAVRAGVAMGGGAALPGMIFNSKKTVTWTDAATGLQRNEPAGRMECTMQNLVDSLAQRFQDPIPVERHAELNTFVVFNKRRRVTSSAKRKRVPGSKVISQTPDCSFLDLMRNSEEVLQRCSFIVPEVGCVEHYLESGPGFIFLFHPALGPLWDVIAQKLRGGALAPGAELVLEVAEVAIADLRLNGSLVVEADCIYGRSQSATGTFGATPAGPPQLAGQSIMYQDTGSEAIQYSPVMPDLAETSGTVVPLPRKLSTLTVAAVGGTREVDLHPSRPAADRTIDDRLSGGGSGGHHSDSGGHNSDSSGRHSDRVEFSAKGPRVRLTGVVIQNQGIDWSHPGNIYWQHKVARREQVKVVLHGQSEFEASHVLLTGSHTFEVPDGYKMVVSAAPGGGVRRALFPLTGRRPSWQWRYLSGPGGAIHLQMEEPISQLPGMPLSARPMASEMPFTYII